MTRRRNTQLFALRHPPPEQIELGGAAYRLARVFKHDFFAATCLYECAAAGEAAPPHKVVVKFGRSQAFCGLGMKWCARWMRNHEEVIYRTLAGVNGVPRWCGRVGELGYAIEYISGSPLDHIQTPPPGLFDRLREIFDAIHARGVAYCDANKRSNIIVTDDGRAFLVDYQIALRRRDELPRPLRNIVSKIVDYLAGRDLYHLYKHKRRMAPGQLTPEEDALSRSRGGLHLLHRRLTKPYRAARRKFLRNQHQKGRLQSPTAEMEDHYQPEKQAWRTDEGADR